MGEGRREADRDHRVRQAPAQRRGVREQQPPVPGVEDVPGATGQCGPYPLVPERVPPAEFQHAHRPPVQRRARRVGGEVGGLGQVQYAYAGERGGEVAGGLLGGDHDRGGTEGAQPRGPQGPLGFPDVPAVRDDRATGRRGVQQREVRAHQGDDGGRPTGAARRGHLQPRQQPPHRDRHPDGAEARALPGQLRDQVAHHLPGGVASPDGRCHPQSTPGASAAGSGVPGAGPLRHGGAGGDRGGCVRHGALRRCGTRNDINRYTVRER